MSRTLILAACLLLISHLECFSQTQTDVKRVHSGYWQFTENFKNAAGNQNAIWSFEFHDDRNSDTITGVGRRSESNGKRVRDRSVAIIFIDRNEQGGFSGSYIEAYGDGEQVELSLAVELAATRKQLNLVARDSNGKQVTRFKGEWIGRGAQAKLQPGKWTVREIVAPANGSYDIEWAHQIEEKNGKISGKGSKTLINARKAYPDEVKTICSINMSRGEGNLNTISGSGLETNPNGKKTRADYQGWVSPSGRAFFLMSYEKDVLSALIFGRYSG